MDARDYQLLCGAHAMDGVDTMPPDEILMAREDGAGGALDEREKMLAECACCASLLQALTRQADDIEDILARVFVLTSRAAPEKMPKKLLDVVSREKLRRAMPAIQEVQWSERAGHALLGVLLAKGWDKREVGVRTLCLLYSLSPRKELRPPMAHSMETIGKAIGLTATNPRSAISARIRTIYVDLIRKMQLRERPHAAPSLWCFKSQNMRNRLKQSMKGKRNRAAPEKTTQAATHHERIS